MPHLLPRFRSLLITLLCLLFFIPLNSQTLPTNPDFAFPKRVIGNAEAVLKTASQRNLGDPAQANIVLQAWIQYFIAKTMVNPADAPKVIDQMEQTLENTPDGDFRAMLSLLLARFYLDYYQTDSWNFDRRELPAQPVPKDITEWSGEMFKTRISELCSDAVKLASHSPLKPYIGAIDASDLELECFPTVRDFALIATVRRFESLDLPAQEYVTMGLEAPIGSASRMAWELEALPDKDSAYREKLYKLATPVEASQWTALPLLELAFNVSSSITLTIDGTKHYSPALTAEAVDAYLKAWPGNQFESYMLDARKRLCAPHVHIRYPDMAASDSIEVRYTVTNASKFTLTAYRLPDDSQGSVDISKLGAPVVTKVVTIDRQAPFTEKGVATIKLPGYGLYTIYPYAEGTIKTRQIHTQWGSIRIAPVLPVAVGSVVNPMVVVVDASKGTPVSGAQVTAKSIYRNQSAKSQTSTTDALGIAKLSNDQKGGTSDLSVRYDGRNFNFRSLRLYTANAEDKEKSTIQARVLTDRAIYHPGDVLRFSAVCASVHIKSDSRESTVAKDLKVNVVLENANSQPVDTLVVTTDAFGRACGEFTLPSEGLTGRFTISVHTDDINYVGDASVMVSDYKIPQMHFTDLGSERGVPGEGCVTVSGRVMTYSGMPVANASVTAELFTSVFPRWYNSSTQLSDSLVTTDAEGRFSLVYTPEMLKDDEDEDEDDDDLFPSAPFFQVRLRAVDSAGQSVSSSVNFSAGKPYALDLGIPDNIDGEKPLNIKATARDANDKVANIPLRWSLERTADSIIVAQGDSLSNIDIKSVRPGSYRIIVTPVDTTLANPASTNVVIYNRASGIVPVKTDIWTPVSSVDYVPGPGTFMITTTGPETTVYVAVGAGNRIHSLKCYTLPEGYHDIPYDLPAEPCQFGIRMFTVRDCETTEIGVSVVRQQRRDLTITGESMRDLLTPGQPETWRFRVTDPDGKPAEAAVVLDLYNEALNALSSHGLNVTFPQWLPNSSMSLRTMSKGSAFLTTSAITQWKQLLWTLPRFNYFGQNPRFSRGENIMYSLRGTSSIYGYRVMGYGVVQEDAVVNEAKSADMLLEQVVTTKSAHTGAEASDGADLARALATQIDDFREAEVAVAAWAPMLTTDAQGNVEYSFTVPNAVATWQLLVAAWDEDTRAGSMMRSFIANKPVMVQPNWPRFLRHGDSTLVMASVFNNTDSAGTAMVDFQIFNPLTGQTLSAGTRMVRVAAGQSVTVDFPLNTLQLGMPQMSAVGARFSARMAGFSDGEQTAVPLLRSEAQLIETTPFYLNPGEDDFTTKLPKAKDARLSLTYCENPAWTIVSALPGLRQNMGYANSAAAAILSAACARGIIADNPAIADALRAWSENPEDSALVSSLQRNEDLKIALLSATPWVQTAMSQTERMGRLSLIFDEKETSSAIAEAVATLRKLQRADGGWAWAEWCKESSTWVTSNIMELMAFLHTHGWMPADKDLADMTAAALAYLDSDDFATRDIVYAIARPQLKDFRAIPAKGRSGIAKTLDDIRARWRDYRADYKALAALALWNNGYESEARGLAASVAQFGVPSPSQGMSFPSVSSLASYGVILEALATIAPDSPAVDGVRQYLIVRKQATDWGSAVVTTQVVTGFLSCGTRWTAPAEPAEITAGKSRIEPTGAAQTATGQLRADLSAYAGKTLTIHRTDALTPAYGAVYAQFSQAMTEVKAASCPDLSVEKGLTVRRDGEWVYADNLRVGDLVKVKLTIKTKRELDYVSVVDERPAAFEPAQQLPGYVYSDGAAFYRENRDAATTLAIMHLSPGTYILEYEMNVARSGSFISGVASVQSQMAPELTAHSSGSLLIIESPED